MPFDSLPLVDKETAGQIEVLFEEYKIGLEGSSKDEIERMMVRLGVLFPNGKLTEQEEDERLRSYVKLLKDVPFDILSDAFATVCKTKTFFPAVAEIRSAAMKAWSARSQVAFDFNRLLLKHQRDWRDPPPPEPPMTQAQVDDANKLFKSLGLKTRYTLEGSYIPTATEPDPVGPPEMPSEIIDAEIVEPPIALPAPPPEQPSLGLDG